MPPPSPAPGDTTPPTNPAGAPPASAIGNGTEPTAAPPPTAPPRCVVWAPPGRSPPPGLLASFQRRGAAVEVVSDSYRALALAAMACRPHRDGPPRGTIVVLCEPAALDAGRAANELADALARYAPRAACWWAAVVPGAGGAPPRAALAPVTPVERAIWAAATAWTPTPTNAGDRPAAQLGPSPATRPAAPAPPTPAAPHFTPGPPTTEPKGPPVAAAGRVEVAVVGRGVLPTPASVPPSRAPGQRPLRLVGLTDTTPAEPGPAPVPGDDGPDAGTGRSGPRPVVQSITADELSMLLGGGEDGGDQPGPDVVGPPSPQPPSSPPPKIWRSSQP